ncbi:MAG: GTP-binding protein, partial [archaeon]|nr:GTP-binding protein [archaeon]
MNFNIWILGHVDSGKTTLAKALSTLQSTASFDKSPQSQERGITLDLGFSAFQMPAPERLAEQGYGEVRFTLVDCPGHASLIRTVLGGAQIIDLMMLVIDASHGIQTQTAECMIIGELLTDQLLIVLNKVDLFPAGSRAEDILRAKRQVRRKMAGTKFASAPIAVLSAGQPDLVPEVATALEGGKRGGGRGGRGGGVAGAAAHLGNPEDCSGLQELMGLLLSRVKVRAPPLPGDPFVLMVDHCFAIKGHGTILTGTVLSGQVAVNQAVEIPLLKVQKKVKSMQIFHKPVKKATTGDRVALCFTQFDPDSLERGLITSPQWLHSVHSIIFQIHPICYFKKPIKSNSSFHITVGHSTMMARILLFVPRSSSASSSSSSPTPIPSCSSSIQEAPPASSSTPA